MRRKNCEICDKEFNLVHYLDKEHKCNVCQKVFMLHGQLTSHMKIIHENKKQHKCDSCKKVFSQAGTLKGHIPPNHLLVEPRYYHSDGSKITLIP